MGLHRQRKKKMKEKMLKVADHRGLKGAKEPSFALHADTGGPAHSYDEDEENAELLESLRRLRDHCFEIASRCCNYLKNIFSSIGATSGGSSYASGDVGGALTWVEKELGELKGVINA